MFDYNIRQKRELDAVFNDMIKRLLDVGGEYPTVITVSPSIYKKMERTFFAVNEGVFEYAGSYGPIPIEIDDSLPGEQIHMHQRPKAIESTESA